MMVNGVTYTSVAGLSNKFSTTNNFTEDDGTSCNRGVMIHNLCILIYCCFVS